MKNEADQLVDGIMRDTSDEAFEALLDFVRNSPGGLRRIAKEPAKRVIERLADEKMEPRKLFSRVMVSTCPDILFSVLYDKVQGDEMRRFELLDAVMAAPERVWEEHVLDVDAVAGKFPSARDFEHLLKYHHEALLHGCDEHCLCGRFSSEEYWLKRVRWFIAKPDYRRAWDELKKAWRGFFIGNDEEMLRFGAFDPESHCHEASRETLATGVVNLHAAMIAAGILTPLTRDDLVLDYSAVTARSSAPSARCRTATIAGFEFACLFRAREGREAGSGCDGKSATGTPHIFGVEGAMVLKIAEYYRQERNAQRRKKWAKRAGA